MRKWWNDAALRRSFRYLQFHDPGYWCRIRSQPELGKDCHNSLASCEHCEKRNCPQNQEYYKNSVDPDAFGQLINKFHRKWPPCASITFSIRMAQTQKCQSSLSTEMTLNISIASVKRCFMSSTEISFIFTLFSQIEVIWSSIHQMDLARVCGADLRPETLTRFVDFKTRS